MNRRVVMGKLISLENIKHAKEDDAAYRSLLLEVAADNLISKLNHEILFRSQYESWNVSVNSLDEIGVTAMKAIAESDLFGSEYHVEVRHEGRETSLVVSAIDYKIAS